MFDDKKIKHFHCVGIGGIGMSGIAEILMKMGHRVTGSDIACGKTVQYLRGLGIEVYEGHDKKHLSDAQALIYSSAIDPANPEYLAALEAQLPIIPRGKMLAELMNNRYGIAVAGAHGKTTTTGLIAYLLHRMGYHPTYVIGGIIQSEKSPAFLGKSDYFVVEADESDASFLYLKPKIAVVLNLDADHLETYHSDMDQLKKAFVHFINGIGPEGKVVLCIDDPYIREILPKIEPPFVTVGFHADADFRVSEFQQNAGHNQFVLCDRKKQDRLEIDLLIPGRHNAVNAAVAIAVIDLLGIDKNRAKDIVKTFPGMNRRFQNYGEVRVNQNKVLLLEDYGHHPNEIKATIAAMRAVWPERRLVMVFQPHRYTRTRDLLKEFVAVLAEVDLLILLDIYSAGEKALPEINGAVLKEAIENSGFQSIHYVAETSQLLDQLSMLLQDQDVIIFQGAGNVGTYAGLMADRFSL